MFLWFAFLLAVSIFQWRGPSVCVVVVDRWDGYAWVGLQWNQSMLQWEGTCNELALSNTSLALFQDGDSSSWSGDQCFVIRKSDFVLDGHNCDHTHSFICERKANAEVSFNMENTTEYMAEDDRSKIPHQCEPVVQADGEGEQTSEKEQTTQMTSVPSESIETSSPANDNAVGTDETSSPATDLQSTDETSSPANDNAVGTDETSSPANDLQSTDETSSPANDTAVGTDETSSPANDNAVGTDETYSPANDLQSTDETSSPANDNAVGSDETSSPANDNAVGTDETSSPANDLQSTDETSSPANDNHGRTDDISDSSETTSHENRVCRLYNVTDMSAEELSAILAAIAKALTLEKKKLSRSIRMKISAPDHRASSTSIGYVAVFIITIPVFLILVLDTPRAVRQVKYVFVGLKNPGRLTQPV
ncbi:uncharacterized protein LOC124143230 [Haliotis rufescens]|uniref:uncharacterized protein LOC124143230 n=1 Tax=Haliotis rufescens TaxID=6454 RepID=UPI00201F5AF1|nr:uncharacterized protein LOC124143230 [Haliotis rufescens]